MQPKMDFLYLQQLDRWPQGGKRSSRGQTLSKNHKHSQLCIYKHKVLCLCIYTSLSSRPPQQPASTSPPQAITNPSQRLLFRFYSSSNQSPCHPLLVLAPENYLLNHPGNDKEAALLLGVLASIRQSTHGRRIPHHY